MLALKVNSMNINLTAMKKFTLLGHFKTSHERRFSSNNITIEYSFKPCILLVIVYTAKIHLS